MNKTERHQKFLDNNVILRSKSDGKGLWYIVRYTENGGWSRFSSIPYVTEELCKNKIDHLVEKYQFIHDDGN